MLLEIGGAADWRWRERGGESRAFCYGSGPCKTADQLHAVIKLWSGLFEFSKDGRFARHLDAFPALRWICQFRIHQTDRNCGPVMVRNAAARCASPNHTGSPAVLDTHSGALELFLVEVVRR